MDNDTFDEVLRTVRGFVRTQVMPREQEIDETDSVPADIAKSAAEMGLFGYALPEQYGGLGVTMSEDVRLAFEFGYTAPAFRSLFGTNNGIAGQMISRFGTEQQRRTYLPALAAGEAIASFALTEAEAGSDPSGLRTSARRIEDHYVIDGHKRFITNAPLARWFVVFARTDPDARGSRGISAFIIDADAPGLSIGPRDKKMGQSGAWTAELFFDGVRVGPDRLLGGEEGSAFSSAMTVLSRGRLHIAALCVGMAERALDESVRYAATSRQGGRALGEYQLVQGLLAESYTELTAGRSLVIDAAAQYDSGIDRVAMPSAAKLFCSEMVGRVTDRAVQIHGGTGYMRASAVERLFRDARLYRIYEGTSEIQKIVIGRALLRTVPE